MEEAFISAKKHTQLAYDWETKLIKNLCALPSPRKRVDLQPNKQTLLSLWPWVFVYFTVKRQGQAYRAETKEIDLQKYNDRENNNRKKSDKTWSRWQGIWLSNHLHDSK